MLTDVVGKDPVPVGLEVFNGGNGLKVKPGAVPEDGTIVELRVGNETPEVGPAVRMILVVTMLDDAVEDRLT